MFKTLIIIILAILLLFICAWSYNWYMGKFAPSAADKATTVSGEAVAYFAGGCFWCVESDYEKLPAVKEVVSGFMGGSIENPSYKEVTEGDTGHREVVKVVYDPSKITYRELVLYLFKHTDPTDDQGSFYDRGYQYTSAVYYSNEEERKIAESVVEELNEQDVFNEPIVTNIEPAGDFWIAEDYHQDFYKKNPLRYNVYRESSGRDDFIESVWGDNTDENSSGNISSNKAWVNFEKPSDEELKNMLTPIQYNVTQEDGTESPFDNEYWDNHDEGIYVDIVSGEPLFSSTDKFDSGTGWPSFLKPIDESFVTEHQDYKLILPRTEIRSKYADSHLGHIILDGPEENDRIRYCMNSAALRFVPKEDMEVNGYGDFLYLFE